MLFSELYKIMVNKVTFVDHLDPPLVSAMTICIVVLLFSPSLSNGAVSFAAMEWCNSVVAQLLCLEDSSKEFVCHN